MNVRQIMTEAVTEQEVRAGQEVNNASAEGIIPLTKGPVHSKAGKL